MLAFSGTYVRWVPLVVSCFSTPVAVRYVSDFLGYRVGEIKSLLDIVCAVSERTGEINPLATGDGAGRAV